MMLSVGSVVMDAESVWGRVLQAGEEVLGKAAKITLGKENTTIVGDGSTQDAVEARVRQIRNVVAETEQDYEREKLNERIAR